MRRGSCVAAIGRFAAVGGAVGVVACVLGVLVAGVAQGHGPMGLGTPGMNLSRPMGNFGGGGSWMPHPYPRPYPHPYPYPYPYYYWPNYYSYYYTYSYPYPYYYPYYGYGSGGSEPSESDRSPSAQPRTPAPSPRYEENPFASKPTDASDAAEKSRSMFKDLDLNSDGNLTPDEFHQGYQRIQNPQSPPLPPHGFGPK